MGTSHYKSHPILNKTPAAGVEKVEVTEGDEFQKCALEMYVIPTTDPTYTCVLFGTYITPELERAVFQGYLAESDGEWSVKHNYPPETPTGEWYTEGHKSKDEAILDLLRIEGLTRDLADVA